MATAKRGSPSQRKGTSRRKIESINWPVDEDGVPMAQISFTASELIPTGDYANVTIGPVTVTRFVPDDDEIKDRLNDLAELVESECIAEQRELVLEQIQGKKK